MTEKEVRPESRRAMWLQRSANALCWLRIGATPFIAEHIATSPDYRSWALAGGIALAGATDKADGILSRQAARLRNSKTGERGAWLDQMSDKVLVHGTLGSMAVSEALQGNHTLAAGLAANQALLIARDWWVTRARKEAPAHVETKARLLGKIKAAAQIGVLAVATSPIIDTPMEEAAVIGGLSATTGLAIASGISLIKELRHEPEAIQPTPQIAA